MLLSNELNALLDEGASRILGRSLSEHERSAFVKYLGLLARWQQAQRLVGSVEPKWLIENVVLDSLLFSTLIPTDARSIADLGSGAGVPGIPLKIVLPQLRFTLIEARERRASFLAAAVRELGLHDCRVVIGRAEDVEETAGDQDIVVMRCAGDLTKMMPVAARLVRDGGLVIASGPPKIQLASERKEGLEWVELHGLKAPRIFATLRKS